jgi:hypothetical protein
MTSPSAEELRRKGAEALQRADYDTAVTSLRAALKANSADVEALVLLGVALSQKGDHAAALAALDRAAELAPVAPNVQYNRSLALERSGALELAEWGFREVLRLDPDHALAKRKLELLTAPPEARVEAAAAPGSTTRPGQPQLGASAPDLKRNLIRCPACRAHTRRGRHCERCSKELPAELRLKAIDPANIELAAPDVGGAIGAVKVVYIGPEGVRANTGGVTGVAMGIVSLLSLAGMAYVGYIALRDSAHLVEKLVPFGALLLVFAVSLRVFASMVAAFRFTTSRRIECSRMGGLSRTVSQAGQFDAVHFAVDLPNREGQEGCWIRFEDADRKAPFRLGPVNAGDAEAAEMLKLAVLLARTLRLPLQVDGYPRNGSEELRQALGKVG